MRIPPTFLSSFAALWALAAAALHAQNPQKIDNVCAPQDAEAVGLACFEDDPCPVYLELSAVDGFGENVFAVGNLHTGDTTLYAVLLASSDAGKTWTEPVKRIRSATLEQIQFVDTGAGETAHGWVSGMLLDPLPRNPFLLLTVNAGEAWHRAPLAAEPNFGVIQQFWFDSDSRGQAVIDRSQGKASKFELYATADGGETWMLQSSSEQAAALPDAKPSGKSDWRVVTGADSYAIERRNSSGWETLALFPTHAGDCK